MSPNEVRKMAEMSIKMPSLNKELSLNTELALNDGARLLDGQTRLMYSPNEDKAVVVKYIIQGGESDTLTYKAGWSLDHVDSQTHLEMSAGVVTKEQEVSGDLQLKYKGSNKDMTTYALQGELDLKQRKADVKLNTPTESAEVQGQVTPESPYTVTIVTSRNQTPRWKTVWTVDTEKRTMDAMMTYNDYKGQVVTSASLPTSNSLVSETSTVTAGETVQEGRLSAELVDRKLHGHLKWRPQLISEVTEYGSEVLEQLIKELSPILESSMKELGEVLLRKHRLISSSLSEELSPVSESLEGELKAVQQDLRSMRRELKRMYRQNELYLKDMEEMYDGAVKSMLAGYSSAIVQLNTAYSKAQEMIEEISNKIDEYPFQEKYNEMMSTVLEEVQKAEVVMMEEIQKLFAKITAGIEEMSLMYDEALTDVSENVRKMLTVLLEEFALTPYIEDLKTAYNSLVNNTRGLTNIDNTRILKLSSQVQQLLADAMEQSTLREKYTTIYAQTKDLISEHFGDLADNKDIQDLNKAILDLYEQVAWLYKYTEMNRPLKELIQKAVDTMRSKVMEEFDTLPLGLFDLHKSKVITFDLENGEIEFDLYLPIPVDNFNDIMKLSIDKYVGKFKKMVDKYFPRRDICLWDFYYSIPPVRWSMRQDWVPPFDVFGTVSGLQHFTTFDGHHFDLAGQCSYVLVQDLDDGNFSVVLKYTGGRGDKELKKDSIVVMVAGKTVELSMNYMVKVDGQPRELPYRTDGLDIVRSGNRVALDSSYGLTVMTDFTNDYHIIGMSGWYHGKVGGLLGNNDNEQYNDIMTSDGASSVRLRKFMNSWEVDGSCKSTVEYSAPEAKTRSEECAAVFNMSSSSLRPCFLKVIPDSYHHSCDMNPVALCDIAALYTKVCERHGIDVSLPKSCVTCQATDSDSFGSDSTLRYKSGSETPLLNSMDVVFVVEERQCNRDIANKLKNVIYRVEQSLTNKGISSNRYSLVGYQGSLVDSHTMEGQLFNDATKFSMGLENMQFRNLGPYADPLSALEYAGSLPFRPGVQKTLILVSCLPCEEAQGYSYSSLASVLGTRDITLHVLRQQGFQLQNRSPKSQIYGVDGKEVFLERNRDDGDLFANLDMPNDYCASLALQSNGSVFDSGNLFVGSVRQQRKFMDSFGDRIQNSDPQCQVCSCEIDSFQVPSTVCRRCDQQPVLTQSLNNIVQKATSFKNTVSQKIEALLF